MPIRSLICTVAAAGGLGASLLADSAIEGRVELPQARGPVVVNKRYTIVSKGGEVATDPALAVVYLEGKFAKPASLPTVQMAQKNLAFVTPLLPVQAGTKVEFPNQDDAFHNIFSYSPAKRFDLGRYRPEERPIPSQVFDTPGLVMLRCDIHEHMRGVVLVLETPHFTTSKPDGTYRLAGLPPGRYSLRAWVSSKKTMEREVEIRNGATMRVDFP
jgi:plastocyanin